MTSTRSKKTGPTAKGSKVRTQGHAERANKTPALKIQTTTLWDFPSQHYGDGKQGDPDYIGATPSYILWNLLQRYSSKGDRILDPMCGSGTTIDVATELGRIPIGFDLAPSREDITQADARELPTKSSSIDFAFIDPPYSTHVDYSDDERCIGKLSAREAFYYDSMELVIKELHRVLKEKSFVALYVSDSAEKAKSFCPIGFELYSLLASYFRPVDIVSVTRHNRKLGLPRWHREAEKGNFFLRGFNYLFIMQKHDAWMQERPVLRRSPNAIKATQGITDSKRKKKAKKKRRGSPI